MTTIIIIIIRPTMIYESSTMHAYRFICKKSEWNSNRLSNISSQCSRLLRCCASKFSTLSLVGTVPLPTPSCIYMCIYRKYQYQYDVSMTGNCRNAHKRVPLAHTYTQAHTHKLWSDIINNIYIYILTTSTNILNICIRFSRSQYIDIPINIIVITLRVYEQSSGRTQAGL